MIFLKTMWQFFSGKSKKADTNSISKSTTVITESALSGHSGYLGYLAKDTDYEQLIRGEKPVFIRFTAKWCKPCKEIEPFFEELADSHKEEGNFISIDVDDFDEIAAQNAAVSIPLFVCYQRGQRRESLAGRDRQLLRTFVLKGLTS